MNKINLDLGEVGEFYFNVDNQYLDIHLYKEFKFDEGFFNISYQVIIEENEITREYYIYFNGEFADEIYILENEVEQSAFKKELEEFDILLNAILKKELGIDKEKYIELFIEQEKN